MPEAWTTFTYIIRLTFDTPTGTVGTLISVSGLGFAANSTSYVWFDTSGDNITDGNEPQVLVTSNATGCLPAMITQVKNKGSILDVNVSLPPELTCLLTPPFVRGTGAGNWPAGIYQYFTIIGSSVYGVIKGTDLESRYNN